MIFVFDLDDTVCDTDGYSEYYINKFIKEHDLPYKQISKVNRYAEAKFNWSEEEALSWYKEYGDKMMSEFPLKMHSKEFINSLYDAGHTIIIATARATDWHTNPKEVTFKWLDEAGIKYDKIYFGRIDKENICKVEKADFFIDDDVKTTRRVRDYFNSLGKNTKQVFLASTDYNQTLDVDGDLIRVNDFLELENYLLKNQLLNNRKK